MRPASLWWLALAAFAFFAFLPTAKPVAHLADMKTLTKTKKPARKLSMSPAAVRARRHRAEDKADYEQALKVCARLDAGIEKARPAQEVWRELGV